jgi:uncharacterized protein YndB with AHSA1/START domain
MGHDHQDVTRKVTRTVDLDAAPDDVWDAVADPERRQAWLDDDDAIDREVRIDSIDDGRSLAWTWWDPGQPTGASRVEIVLTELATGGTRVAVTERLVAPPGAGAATATMTAQARLGAGSAWDSRLLGLELLLLTAGICVG